MEDNQNESPQKPKVPNKLGLGIGAGLALGVAIGAAMDNIGAGIAIGIAGALSESRFTENVEAPPFPYPS